MALSITELIELVTIWSIFCLIACYFETRAENKKLLKENRKLRKALK